MSAYETAIAAFVVAALCAVGYIVRCLVKGTEAYQDSERLDWLEYTADGILWQTNYTGRITRRTIDAARRKERT